MSEIQLAALVAARVSLLDETRQKIGPDKLIVYNGLMKDDPKKLLHFADGAMIERFGHFETGSSKEHIAAFFEATQTRLGTAKSSCSRRGRAFRIGNPT